ncbi:succinylglutamate desuccinylase/aspartoacylase domain-containing protein [Photobacterium sp. Hal280]|uniref:succinylglutamate desuccinylase/aspartoacylase domain-containing protein n=1 Tax=Photobacterium sp. Hal280 TaxID=3035163 RepID=UPI003FA7E4F3
MRCWGAITVKNSWLPKGESVVFPNPNVALGQRACLLVKQSDVDLTDQVVAKF